jgi:hypothetical protein
MVRHAGVLVMSMDETMKMKTRHFFLSWSLIGNALFMTAGWL